MHRHFNKADIIIQRHQALKSLLCYPRTTDTLMLIINFIVLFVIQHHVTVELILIRQLIYKDKLFSHDTSIDRLVFTYY